jgi:hypothetical protein
VFGTVVARILAADPWSPTFGTITNMVSTRPVAEPKCHRLVFHAFEMLESKNLPGLS